MKLKPIILVVIAISVLSTGCARTKKAIEVLTGDDDYTDSSNTSEPTTKETKAVKKKLKAPKPAQSRLADSSSRYKIPSSGMTWHAKGGRLKTIDAEPATMEASIGQAFKQVFLFSMTSKIALISNGTSAFEKIHSTKPVFYTRHDPLNFGIGRYTVQPDRNRRFVWVTMRTGSTAADFYPYEDSIGFDYSKVANGVYKIVLRETLGPGEYVVAAAKDDKVVAYNFEITATAKQKTSTNNTLVKSAQQRLTELGYDPGPADGLFGKRVSAALTKFQLDNNIPTTGRLDSKTIKALKISNSN